MKRPSLGKLVPTLIIIVCTIFFIPWKKYHPLIIKERDDIERKFIDYVDSTTPRDLYQRNRVGFILPQNANLNSFYPDTLQVHFTKDIFSVVDPCDYDEMKASWNVGSLKYISKKGNWEPLYPKYRYNESFEIPVTVNNDFMLRPELFLLLLPSELRKDADGNKAKVFFPTQNNMKL